MLRNTLEINLQVANTYENHYQGSIHRVGRALSDAQDKMALESQVLEMVQDPELDPYNRLTMAYLFCTYNRHLSNKDHQKTNEQMLRKAIAEWPVYMREVWKK